MLTRCAGVLIATHLLTVAAVRADTAVVVVGSNISGSTGGGDPAPDGNGIFFGSGVPVINGLGQVAFNATFTLTNGSTGLPGGIVRGSAAPGSLRLVVRQGDPAPDGNGNFGVIDVFDGPALDDAGQVAFPATFVRTFPTLLFSSGYTSNTLSAPTVSV